MRWLEVLAVGWYVIEETGSPMAVALVLFSASAVVPARRVCRRHFGARRPAHDPARRLHHHDRDQGLLAVLAFLGWLTVYLVAAGVFCSGVIWALDFPVRRTMLGELAGPSRFGTAMALDSATTNLTRMLGPLAGGALMLTIGISGAYLASVACFGGAALLLLFTSYGDRPRRPPAGASSSMSAMPSPTCRMHRWVLGTVLLTVMMMSSLSVSQHDPGDRQGRTRTGRPRDRLAGCLRKRRRPLLRRWSSPRLSGRATSCVSMSFQARRSSHAVSGFSFTRGYPEAMTVLLASGIGFAGFSAMQGALILHSAAPTMAARVMGVMTVAIGAGGRSARCMSASWRSIWAPRPLSASWGGRLACMALVLLAIPGAPPLAQARAAVSARLSYSGREAHYGRQPARRTCIPMPAPLRFGIFLAPFHPVNENPTACLDRDMELIEHLDRWATTRSGSASTIPRFRDHCCPEMFIAAAAERTRHIRLGTGVVSLPYHHPSRCGPDGAARPHDEGARHVRRRAGALAGDAFRMGIDPREQRRMMNEAPMR